MQSCWFRPTDAEQLESLANRLELLQFASLSQVSRGWREACFVWLGRRAAAPFFTRPTAGALHYIARRMPQLRKIHLDFTRGPAVVDLTAISLNCPHLEHLSLALAAAPRYGSNDSRYRTGTLSAVARGCPLLSRLRLRGRLLGAEVTAVIEALAHLVELDFDARDGEGGVFIMDGLPLMAALVGHCGTLELLALRGITWAEAGEVDLFEGRPPFTNLREVRFCDEHRGPSPSDADLRRLFDTAVNLETLHISTRRLANLQTGLPRLKHLSCHPQYYSEAVHEPLTASMASIMARFPRLERFDMKNYMQLGLQWQSEVDTRVVPTACGAMMKIAKLARCSLTDAELSVLLDGCPQLEVLDISWNGNLTTLARTSGEFERLQHLDISQCFNLESMAFSFPQLEELHAVHCSRLTALPISCPRMRLLDLSKSGRPALFEGLSILTWPLLDVLRLDQWATLTDSQLLTCIDGRYRLQTLGLEGCTLLTDAAIDTIVQNCPRLRELNVYACRQLTADAVGAIGRLRHLVSLRLVADSRLTDAVDQLCQQRPILEPGITRVPHLSLNEALNLRVVDDHNNEICFKLFYGTPLERVTDAFCQRQGIQRNSVRFLFDGNMIRDDQFPFQLEMEDGDTIDCVVEQVNIGE